MDLALHTYTEVGDCKILKTQINVKIYHVHGLESTMWLNVHNINSDLKINGTPIKTPMTFFLTKSR